MRAPVGASKPCSAVLLVSTSNILSSALLPTATCAQMQRGDLMFAGPSGWVPAGSSGNDADVWYFSGDGEQGAGDPEEQSTGKPSRRDPSHPHTLLPVLLSLFTPSLFTPSIFTPSLFTPSCPSCSPCF